MTVLYGHLNLKNVIAKTGATIQTGEALGFLGADKSAETDGERKHLHLGIHKGEEIELRGYVSVESELSAWIDPCLYVCAK